MEAVRFYRVFYFLHFDLVLQNNGFNKRRTYNPFIFNSL